MKCLIFLICMLLPLPAFSRDLKITTWNLDWLTSRPAGDPRLPADVTPRSADDFARLAQYALELNADVIAVEEVDGAAAAGRIFPPDRYSIHMTHDHVMQRVGLVVRRGLHYTVNPDLVALSMNHLRSGADITLSLDSGELRILAVHLKKGCRDIPLNKAKSQVCQEFRDQIPPLAAWIAARQLEGTAFVVLGDFNRWMDGRDAFLAELRKAAPLTRATEGRSSPCWGGENFIDHVLAGGAAATWMQPETLRVLTYRETDRSMKDRLSDHCPVSVRFEVPE
jgi:endonuclease/exonuclease/phosphatase family metal-dependent hydrolase